MYMSKYILRKVATLYLPHVPSLRVEDAVYKHSESVYGEGRID